MPAFLWPLFLTALSEAVPLLHFTFPFFFFFFAESSVTNDPVFAQTDIDVAVTGRLDRKGRHYFFSYVPLFVVSNLTEVSLLA